MTHPRHKHPFDSREYRNACGTFATGITIVTTEHEGNIHGMTANGFLSVSLEPAIVAITVGNENKLHAMLQQSGKYAVSVLSADLEAWSSHFAGWHQEGLEITFERFGGLPVIPGAMAYFAADVDQSVLVGDHTLYLGRVNSFAYGDAEPILYYKGAYRRIAG